MNLCNSDSQESSKILILLILLRHSTSLNVVAMWIIYVTKFQNWFFPEMWMKSLLHRSGPRHAAFTKLRL